ncbi:hypothetical protein ScPMuIL_018829 [Solemya velum]
MSNLEDRHVFPDPNRPMNGMNDGEKHFYRYLMVDEKSKRLYVGAMNYVYGLNLTDISDSNFYSIYLPPAPLQNVQCTVQGKKDIPDCQNHIRFIARNETVSNTIDDDEPTLFVCSSGAYKPQGYHLSIPRLERKSPDLSATGTCPFDPFDNATAVLAEKGNPGGVSAVYSGTAADFNKVDPIIYRPTLYESDGSQASWYMKTLAKNTKWLNSPQFVGSFDVGNQVFFFFREVAGEYTNCGKKIYSRVAKVCKNDKGAYDISKNAWTSFQKARLNCSIPGQYPYYFDEIQDVYTEDNKVFYGLFTTNINGLTASAICAFTVAEINRAFNGPFKKQDEDGNWQTVQESEMPSIRPGNCSYENTRSLPTDSLSFIHSRPLMDTVVSHQYGKPIFHKGNCLMQRLSVVSNVSGNGDIVFFTASNRGEVFKIVSWQSSQANAPSSGIATTYIPFEESLPIWSMKLRKHVLYLGTDMRVGQISVNTCKTYKQVDACMYDPYCEWLDEGCRSYTGHTKALRYSSINWSEPIEPQIEKKIGYLFDIHNVTSWIGLSRRFHVNYKLCVKGHVEWKKSNKFFTNCVQALDHSLIITEILQDHEGVYEAFDEANRKVAEYNLQVHDEDQVEREWLRKFDEWCDHFSEYKLKFKRWESKCLPLDLTTSYP